MNGRWLYRAFLYFTVLFAIYSCIDDCSRAIRFYLFIAFSFCLYDWFVFTSDTSLEKISAFTVNLSYNLEPIYSIILAMLLFSEAKELNAAFYIGLGVIILSVILQTLSVIRSNKKI